MAFRAKDGRAFGRRDQMRAYDERSNLPVKRADKDASDEREGHERKEYGGSLESKPHQPPQEVETQQRRGENPARNPNPGPREASASSPEPIEGVSEENPAEAGGSLEPGGEDISHMNIGDAVRAHGVANHIQVRSSGGMHHVTSTHGGRTHTSSHPTPHSAALHVGDALGLNVNQATANLAAQPQFEDQIPGMRNQYR